MTSKINSQSFISARVAEYSIPPMKDMLVLGKNSPIGCIAMRRALDLLMKTPYEHLELDDNVISDILVRSPIIRRISKDHLISFVLDHIKPLLVPEELLQVELDINIYLSNNQ